MTRPLPVPYAHAQCDACGTVTLRPAPSASRGMGLGTVEPRGCGMPTNPTLLRGTLAGTIGHDAWGREVVTAHTALGQKGGWIRGARHIQYPGADQQVLTPEAAA
ncbi:MAG: hypothetical protein JJE16_02085 [Nitrospiraceae bacterium]|nr:hypothetical protein [Nitrospiraceae bacterium]